MSQKPFFAFAFLALYSYSSAQMPVQAPVRVSNPVLLRQLCLEHRQELKTILSPQQLIRVCGRVKGMRPLKSRTPVSASPTLQSVENAVENINQAPGSTDSRIRTLYDGNQDSQGNSSPVGSPERPTQTQSPAPLPTPSPQTATKQQKPGAKKKINARENIALIGDRNVKRWSRISTEKEIAIGKYYATQVEREAPIVKDPVIAEYINRIGQNLVANSDDKDRLSFTFKVVDSKDINAFSLPGGFLYINTGLILNVKNEAQLAAVMGHEVAHVCARHQVAQMTRMNIIRWATLPLIFIPYTWPVYAGEQAAGIALPLAFLKFERGFESEADFLGLQYQYAAGYDPKEFSKVFELLMKEAPEKANKGSIWSDHPATKDRLAAINRDADFVLPDGSKMLPEREDNIVQTSEFLDIQNRLREILRKRQQADQDANKPSLERDRKKGKKGDKSEPDLDPNHDPKKDDQPTIKRH